MRTTQELRKMLVRTTSIRELMEEIQQRPVELLLRITREHTRKGGPVADHQLGPINYLTNMALRALIETELIQGEEPSRYFIRAFTPTKKGLDYVRRIEEDGTPTRRRG